ncbi:prepilin peptidase [Temperatibacter marinus]|uniref:Prepilin peptidase n=1 Tax=Temperatibacter marinus TaxID=1456591 RepID=A0AA52EIG9_9PROT|nr:prepilin peptidase [Temperatibacter marinus]WND02651.1 prepilin peptidase [Temperatibacter marinus]
MPFEIVLVIMLLTIAATALLFAAHQDVKSRVISNQFNVFFLGLSVIILVISYLSNLLSASDLFSHVTTGLILLIICFAGFGLGLMGGGDAKLIPSVAMLAGGHLVPLFLIFTAIAGGLLALMMMTFTRLVGQQSTNLMMNKVPYAVAIAVGGIMIIIRLILNIVTGGSYA